MDVRGLYDAFRWFAGQLQTSVSPIKKSKNSSIKNVTNFRFTDFMMIALNKIRNIANALHLDHVNGNDEASKFKDEIRFTLNWDLKKVKGTPSDDALKKFLL